MKYIVTLNGKEYEVEVEKGTANAVYLGEAQAVTTTLAQPAESAVAQAVATPSAPAGAGDPVSAPMPGAIVAVNVTNGQAVKKGDVLFILEAMKMENEISAPKDGTITSITTTKGGTVDTGTVLCTLA